MIDYSRAKKQDHKQFYRAIHNLAIKDHKLKSSTASTPLVSASKTAVIDFTTAEYYEAIPACVIPKFSLHHYTTYHDEYSATTSARDRLSSSDLGNLLIGGT